MMMMMMTMMMINDLIFVNQRCVNNLLQNGQKIS